MSKIAVTSIKHDGSAVDNLTLRSDGNVVNGGNIYYNSRHITSDVTIVADANGLSAGTIYIDSGVTVTIDSDAEWSIV